MSRRPRTAMLAAAAVELLFAAAMTACGGGPPSPSISPLEFPGKAGSGQPRLTGGPGGAPILSWIEPDGEADVLRYAPFEGDAFGGVHEVVRSERMFVNWADFPSVTPITAKLWFAHWLRLQPDSHGAYDIGTAISTDGGLSWAPAEQMNEDDTEAEHGFVSVFPWDRGIAAFWLDGRELANWSFDEPDALLGTSLRLARYAADGSVVQREIADELVCDCCQPDVAMTTAGPLVIYRDRTEDEIRDVVVRRYVDGRWTAPMGLGNEGWHIEGCPVNGPVVAADGDTVVAAWFTAPDNHARVRFARSDDAGAHFSDPVDVGTRGALGQSAIVLDQDGRALVSWWRRAEAGGIDLQVRSFEPNGAASEPIVIGHEDASQAVDVPQMIAADDGYLLAWTSLAGAGSVKLARLYLAH